MQSLIYEDCLFKQDGNNIYSVKSKIGYCFRINEIASNEFITSSPENKDDHGLLYYLFNMPDLLFKKENKEIFRLHFVKSKIEIYFGQDIYPVNCLSKFYSFYPKYKVPGFFSFDYGYDSSSLEILSDDPDWIWVALSVSYVIEIRNSRGNVGGF